MKDIDKQGFKRIAAQALQDEYGFAPALKDIILLEADMDRTYILFSVKNNEYKFRSYYFGREYNEPCLYTGPGTIERII